MERDSRRDRGQWRGVHSFKDIICDGDDNSSISSQRRDGGLKMGHSYYYYYEVDGATEIHDPSLPSTNACPYLPGQTVNTMWVPVEEVTRKRRASLSSVHRDDFKTMDPDTRFMSPRPAPSPPTTPALRYIDSAPGLAVNNKRPARSVSPASSWASLPRKLFHHKASESSLRESLRGRRSPSVPDEERSYQSMDIQAPTSQTNPHQLTSESLRRFLAEEPVAKEEVDDTATTTDTMPAPSLVIPEDIVEDNEDDDNFATTATSETAPFTILSPPPSQRSYSPTPPATIVPPSAAPSPVLSRPSRTLYTPPLLPATTTVPAGLEHLRRFQFPQPQSHFSIDSSCYSRSPESPDSTSPPSFYNSEDEDEEDDEDSARDEEFSTPTMDAAEQDGGAAGEAFTRGRGLGATLSTYSLPRSGGGKMAEGGAPTPTADAAGERRATLGSPALLARNENDVPVGNTSLLAAPIRDLGVDDLVQELSWMAGAIQGKFF